MRGNARTLDWLDPSYELGYEVITMERYRELGQARTIEIIQDRIGDMPLYVTLDLDCFDPMVAPAVANIEPGVGGFLVDEVMPILQSVRGRNVIGGDVACLMPTKDSPNKITALLSAAVMFEIISLIADGHRGG